MTANLTISNQIKYSGLIHCMLYLSFHTLYSKEYGKVMLEMSRSIFEFSYNFRYFGTNRSAPANKKHQTLLVCG